MFNKSAFVFILSAFFVCRVATAEIIKVYPSPTPTGSPAPYAAIINEFNDCTDSLLKSGLAANPSEKFVFCKGRLVDEIATVKWNDPFFGRVTTVANTTEAVDMNSNVVTRQKADFRFFGTLPPERGGTTFDCRLSVKNDSGKLDWKSALSEPPTGRCPKGEDLVTPFIGRLFTMQAWSWDVRFRGNSYATSTTPLIDDFFKRMPDSSATIGTTATIGVKFGVRSPMCFRLELNGELYSSDTGNWWFDQVGKPDYLLGASTYRTSAVNQGDTTLKTSVVRKVSQGDLFLFTFNNSEFQARKKAIGATDAIGVWINSVVITPLTTTQCN